MWVGLGLLASQRNLDCGICIEIVNLWLILLIYNALVAGSQMEKQVLIFNLFEIFHPYYRGYQSPSCSDYDIF